MVLWGVSSYLAIEETYEMLPGLQQSCQ